MSYYTYRRGSIFWALTLIAVGVIFLYQNFNPTIHPWHIIAKFWPILIIFWGLSKLIDYLQAQAHPETVPPPLFTASEVILLILILAVGTLVSKIVLRPWQQWPSALGVNIDDEDFGNLFLTPYSYTQTLSKVSKGQPHLLVVDRRGDVEVRASDQATSAALDAVVKKTVRAESEDAARKLSDQVIVDLVNRGGQYVLETNLDSLPSGGHNVRLDYGLRVPRATTTEITAERGDIVLDGLRGDQSLTVRHGDVHATKVEGLIRLHKSGGAAEIREVKGNVEVDGRGGDMEIESVAGTVTVNGEFSGSLQFRDVAQTLRFISSRTTLTVQKLTGRLNMEMGSLDATGVEGPFDISTREKDISLEDFKHAVKIVNTNGDVRLRTSSLPLHSIEVDLKKGRIELELPAGSSFEIQATSRHGEVDSDFSGPDLKVENQGDAPSITGSYGKGGPTIRLSTAYGTIRVARQSTLPPAPARPQGPRRPPVKAQKGSAGRLSAHAQPATHSITLARVSKNLGKEISTQALSLITVVPSATRPATAKAMAIRWSP